MCDDRQMTWAEIAQENGKLRNENKDLKQQLKEQEALYDDTMRRKMKQINEQSAEIRKLKGLLKRARAYVPSDFSKLATELVKQITKAVGEEL